MKPATKKLAPYVAQPWAAKMIFNLFQIMRADPARAPKCEELRTEIESGQVSSLEAARRFKTLR